MFTPTPTAVSVGSPSPEVCSVEGRRRRRSIHIVRRVAAARLEQGLVDEISQASRQQLQGIDQVTQSVAEMEKVTQTTAATAEESAAASEELGANADQAMEIVRRLDCLVGGHASAEAVRPVPTGAHAAEVNPHLNVAA